MRSFLCFVAALVLLRSTGLAWSSAGHEVIAALAWHELPATTKAKIFETLKAHPDFENWRDSFQGDSGTVDLPTFVFLKASVWPDQVRRKHSRNDHPRWHYINWPLRAPSFSLGDEPLPNDNVLFAITQCEKVLADPNASAEERAIYLSWLAHLCGDIAQPLHCVSFFDKDHPSGDKGGNDCYVKPASRAVKLHALWDGLLGTSGKPQQHMNYAIEITTEHPRKSLPDLVRDRTATEWSLEGRGISIEKVYLRGQLRGSPSEDNAPPLPGGYTKEAKAVAERQAAKAGYRLADELTRLLH